MFQNCKSEIKLFIIVAIISVIITVAGVWLLKTAQSPATQTPLSPQPQTDILDTSIWQTHRNQLQEGETYKLMEIGLPSDWNVITPLTHDYLLTESKGFRVVLQIWNENKMVQRKDETTGAFYETTLLEAREELWRESFSSTFLESINREVMQGEFRGVSESGWYHISTNIRISPYIYSITLSEIDPKQDGLSDLTRLLNAQILSTFRFIDSKEKQREKTIDKTL